MKIETQKQETEYNLKINAEEYWLIVLGLQLIELKHIKEICHNDNERTLYVNSAQMFHTLLEQILGDYNEITNGAGFLYREFKARGEME